MMSHNLIPITAFGAALALALLVINPIALLRRPDRDSGDLWTRVLVYCVSPLVILILIAWFQRLFAPDFWDRGYHLLFDESGLAGLQSPALITLAIPFGLWLITALVLLALPPATRRSGLRPGSWLAGATGIKSSRQWVLYTLVPALMILLIWSFDHLSTRPSFDPINAYPYVYHGAIWGTLAIAAVTLILIALSTQDRDRKGEAREIADERPRIRRGNWVKAMRKRGFDVHTLVNLETRAQMPELRDPRARKLVEEMPFLQARKVAPELIETVAELLDASSTASVVSTQQPVSGSPRNNPCSKKDEAGLVPRNRLVLGPDDCGQEEILAVAARLAHQRLKAITLIIVPDQADTLAARLTRWLPVTGSIHQPRSDTTPDNTALIWILTAASLSENLAELIGNPLVCDRIGLTVWWDLHAYSGVMAANFWAISHRYQRLIRRKGRQDMRSLTFARDYPSPDADFTHYASQLLPFVLNTQDRVVIDPRRPQTIAVHLLEPTKRLKPSDLVNPAHWDASLLAAQASVEAGWSTHYQPPGSLDMDKAQGFLQQQVGDLPLNRQLIPDQAASAARVLEIQPSNLLSLTHLLAQGGRAEEGLDVHQVGVFLPPGNAYVRYLLMLLRDEPEDFFDLYRRLIPGAPQPTIVRRHLLLALREMEAVASGLLHSLQWRSDIINKMLASLTDDGKIEQWDVRFLDADKRLQVEPGYKSSLAEYEPEPLDTVGDELISVILREAGDTAKQELMRIDPERATIQAYPGRIFRIDGQTYQIADWTDIHDVSRDGHLYCSRTENPALTWRLHESSLRGMHHKGDQNQQFFDNTRLSSSVIEAVYEEEVNGVLEVRRDPKTGRYDTLDSPWDRTLASPAMPTKGILLRFLEADLVEGDGNTQSNALHSIAQALHQVVAVHIGVDDDAVAVVALDIDGERIDGNREWGLVIVDLYPHGIGLVDAIAERSVLLVRLLHLTRDWLDNCCNKDEGCEHCLQSPPAIAATTRVYGRELHRGQALTVLNRVLCKTKNKE